MDLVVDDLVIEYTSGDYVLRPVDHLSFEVPSGSLALLLGPSGCGKSTLLSCLAGILTPTSGTISLGGKKISGLTGSALTEYRRSTVGIVFQAFNLVPSLTAAENVMAPLRAAGVGRSAAQARAGALLDQVAMAERADHLPAKLSGGQQQRVAIARALAHEPPMVLADEPTAHLDYVQVEAVLRLIRSLAQPGRSVIVATHDDRMLPLADVVIEMMPKFAEGADRPEKVELQPGEVLFEQGSLGGKIYVVDAGEIDIVRRHDHGGEEVVYVNREGSHFGEMGPLFDLPRSATARAGSKGAKVTGYTLRQFSEIVGLETLDITLGKAGFGQPTAVKKTAAKKAAKARARKTAAPSKTAAKKTAAKKTAAKKAATKKTASKTSAR